MGPPMFSRHFPFGPGVKAFRRDAGIEAMPRLGQEAPELLAFSRVIASWFGRLPARQHGFKRCPGKFGVRLKEQVEPQYPVALRFILIAPALHQRAMRSEERRVGNKGVST